jgi:hypothetical protein
MPTARHLQTTFSAGEFDPLLYSREDVTFFYNSARILENVVPLPQGGVKRREGWAWRAMQRGPLTAIDLAPVTFSTTNGGTVANAKDGNPATLFTTSTAIGVTATYQVIRLDFGSAQPVSFLDFTGLRILSLPGGIESVAVAVQSSTNASTWTTIKTLAIGNVAQNRRFAMPPDQRLSNTRYLRLVVLNTTDLVGATVQFSDAAAWLEGGYTTGSAPGEFNLMRLTASVADEYHLILTAGNIDAFRADTGAWVAAIPLPHGEGSVATTTFAPNLDTLILYHPDVPTYFVQRVAGDANWRSTPVQFESLARIAFDTGTISGGVNEKQVVRPGSMAAGHKVVVEYNGESSAEITWSATAATNASAVEAAIEGLSDITSVSVTLYDPGGSGSGTGANAALQIEFTGIDGKRAWPILVFNILTGSGTITLDRLQYGQPDTDDLWSATRGYASCGGFYQGRHWMGGFRSRPDVLVGSRAGSFFDFKLDADPVAGSPILVAPNVDDQVAIKAIFPGRHLQIFTTSTEFYIPEEPITVDNIALKATSRFGANDFTKPVDVQGGTIFLDRNGRALREYLYTDTEASYSAEPISIMGGHLVSSPRFLCLRRAQDVDKPTLLLLSNTGADRFGQTVPAAFCVIDRAQQVTGFVRVKTQGIPLGFSTSQAGDAIAVTRRTLGGKSWNFIEVFDEDRMSDASVVITNPDVEEFTAVADQVDFTYTFTGPLDPQDVAVWWKDGPIWRRAGEADYALDLDLKVVSFTNPRRAGDLIRINPRLGLVDVSAFAFMSDAQFYVHADGIPIGEFEPVAGEIDIGDRRFDFAAEVGLRQVPRVVMHPYKGKGDQSPTMRNMRIFEALIQMERSGALTIGIEGGRQRPVSFTRYDSGLMDPVLEETLFSGPKRIAGLGGWEKEPRLEFSQDAPMPFLLRSVTFDVRL